jgi:antitoxin (DNA-binding transcriptional repressor) of toxin-antitoxin stability system
MLAVTLEEIQRDPRAVLERVRLGQTLLLTEGEEILAEIKPVKKQRPIGLSKGRFVVPGDFDAPLPDEILKRLQGGE